MTDDTSRERLIGDDLIDVFHDIPTAHAPGGYYIQEMHIMKKYPQKPWLACLMAGS